MTWKNKSYSNTLVWWWKGIKLQGCCSKASTRFAFSLSPRRCRHTTSHSGPSQVPRPSCVDQPSELGNLTTLDHNYKASSFHWKATHKYLMYLHISDFPAHVFLCFFVYQVNYRLPFNRKYKPIDFHQDHCSAFSIQCCEVVGVERCMGDTWQRKALYVGYLTNEMRQMWISLDDIMKHTGSEVFSSFLF